MAKVTGPLLSERAHGTFNDVLTFSQRKSCQQARYQRKQLDRETAARLLERGTFLDGVIYWGTLTTAEKKIYTTKARGLNMTGYDVFIRDWLFGTIAIAQYILLEDNAYLLTQDGGKVRAQ